MNSLPLTDKNSDTGILSFEIPTPFPIGPVNLYLILGEKLTLVDAGPKTEEAWKSLIYQLNKNGIRIKNIDQLILTHHHVDHGGLASILLQHHPDLKILAHKNSVPFIEKGPELHERRRAFFESIYGSHGILSHHIQQVKEYQSYLDQFSDPARVDQVVEDGQTIEGLDGWIVIHNPGHSQGHISLYHEESQTVIAGDHLIGSTSPGAFVEPSFHTEGSRSRSTVDYKYSLQRMKNLKMEKVFSGHGRVILNPYEIIDQQLKRLEQRANQVKEVLRQEPLRVFDLMKRLYPERYEKHLPLFFSEVLGSLDLLEEKGEVTTVIQDNMIHYRLTAN